MSNNQQWDDFDDNDMGDQGEGPKALRDALKKAQKQNEQMQAQLAELTKAQRDRSIKDALTASGYNPALAKFIPSDVQDADGAQAWLNELTQAIAPAGGSQDDTPVSQPGDPLAGTVTPPAVGMAAEHVAAMQAINAASTGGVPATSEAQVLAQIQNASTPEELDRLIYGR